MNQLQIFKDNQFGENIGSEFGGYHYAIVIHESKYTAIIAPLTSKKERTPKWVLEDDLVVDMGMVKGYPTEDKECFACVSLLQSVSKKRLDRCGNKKDEFFDIEISNEQMDLIDHVIANNFTNHVDIPVSP